LTLMSRRHNGEGSIFPYRNGFAAYVWIVTPAGRRQRKYVYGQTREVVHEKWLALSTAARRGPVAPRSPRLEDYLHRWLEETVEPSLAPSTVANYRLFSRAYIEPDLGSRRLDRLTVRDVQLWMNTLPDAVPVLLPREGRGAGNPPVLCNRQLLPADGVRMDPAPGLDGFAERAQCSGPRRTGFAQRGRTGQGSNAASSARCGLDGGAVAAIP
jgi:hypothetical protein